MKKIKFNIFTEWFRNNLHHFVFVTSILSLAMMVTWWSFFIYRSIEDRSVQQKIILKHELDSILHRIVEDRSIPAVPGKISIDQRFDIVGSKPGEGSVYSAISGSDPILFLSVADHIIEKIDKDQRRKKIMVFGESGLLVLIVFISMIFLFKFIYLEKRTTREMEEFWGRISHEIRTPITGLRSFLESLRDGAISKEKLPAFVKLALKQIEKQERLAENVLTGSSFKSNIKLRIERFDVISFLEMYLREHSVSLAEGKLLYDFSEYNALSVLGDKYALEFILDNIIDNAGKYSSSELALSIRVEISGKNVVILLSDNGPGFKASCSEKIFNAYKYMRDELPETPHGTGMGLYISRKLARQMNGDINASSEGRGRGATFRVVLPSGKKNGL